MITENTKVLMDDIDGKEIEQTVTRVYSWKWCKVDDGKENVSYVRTSLLREKVEPIVED